MHSSDSVTKGRSDGAAHESLKKIGSLTFYEALAYDVTHRP
jgi:hypothetical protein